MTFGNADFFLIILLKYRQESEFTEFRKIYDRALFLLLLQEKRREDKRI